KNENLLQAPLYMLAAQEAYHVRPEGMFYVGLRDEVIYSGWSATPLLNSLAPPENWLAAARERALRIVQEIRSGRIEAMPADVEKCRYCDYRDACRVDVAQEMTGAETG